MIKKLFTLVALLSLASLQANDATPTLVLRSQGRHADRQELVGMTDYIHLKEEGKNYTVFDMAIAYAQSFRGDRLARSLFGSDVNCDCGATIYVEGSNAVNANEITERNPQAWLADYLYLNCNFTGEFTLKPKIQNVMVDLDLYVGLNHIWEGAYFRIYGPITWTKWKTGFCSNSDASLTTSCPFGGTGYFTPDGSEVLLSKLSDYFIGKSPDVAGGVTFQPLKYAKMGADCDVCGNTQAGFADLRAELGYEVFRSEDYHLGLNIQTAAPTGNRRRAEFVMQPVVGNGNHWELGGGLDLHYTFWRGESEDRSMTFFLDADITHLFGGNEQRTFDLKDKTNSRYMLASRMTRNVVNSLQGATNNNPLSASFTPSTYQFNYEYAPVANLTTLDVRVSVGVQADIVAMFTYKCGNFNFDFGYDFWGRSCEDISCPNDCNPCSQSLCSINGTNQWALKGDARMFGYDINGTGGITVNTAVALGSSESNADIHGGTNINATVDSITPGLITNPRLQNVGVDYPQFAVAGTGTPPDRLIHTPSTQGGVNTAGQQIMTSIQTVLLSCDDIDLEATRGISNTVFANVSHSWERDNRTTFLGIGASAEFGKAPSCCDNDRDCGEDSCKNCLNSAVSQWTVWLKGGVSFN
jgi:hypothetical protein